MRKKILLANHYTAEAFTLLQEEVPTEYEIAQLSFPTKEALVAAIQDVDYLIASGRLEISAPVLSKAKRLQMVARTGVGLDAIDLDALHNRSIPLYVNQGVNATSVAEHTLLLILACLRRLTEIDANTKKGIWGKQAQGIQTHELRGKTACVIGMGAVGREVAALLDAFGCNVTGCDFKETRQLGRYLSKADIVTLHCPLTSETKHMINAEQLSILKPHAVIINTARGSLIDEEALIQSLNEGTVSFAGLDVFESEPLPAGSGLLAHERVILTPHIGGITYESFKRMMRGAIRNIVCFDKGARDEIEAFRYRAKNEA